MKYKDNFVIIEYEQEPQHPHLIVQISDNRNDEEINLDTLLHVRNQNGAVIVA
jgi:hypothetical protein